jgi:hypothetical protein
VSHSHTAIVAQLWGTVHAVARRQAGKIELSVWPGLLAESRGRLSAACAYWRYAPRTGAGPIDIYAAPSVPSSPRHAPSSRRGQGRSMSKSGSWPRPMPVLAGLGRPRLPLSGGDGTACSTQIPLVPMASCAHVPPSEFRECDLCGPMACQWFPGAYDLRAPSWAHVRVRGAAEL